MNKDLSPIQQELLTKADSIFQSIASTAGKAYDVAAEQLPDLAIQYIAYGRAISVAHLVSVLGILAVCAWVTKWLWKESQGVILMVTGGVSATTLLIYSLNVGSDIMVWFVPKIWLIQEIVKLVK